MTNKEKMAILKLIFTTLFHSKATGSDITKVVIPTNMGQFPGRWFSDNTLRGFDVSINLGTRVIDIRCVEQNPNKLDNRGNLKWSANLARQGHKMMWVIDRNGGFLGRLQDDEWIPGFEPAVQPVKAYNYNTPEHEARVDTAYAHINKDYEDPNFHGIPGTSGTPMANLPIEAAMQHNLPQPGAQNAVAQTDVPYVDPNASYGQDLADSLEIGELPEIPNAADIPEYILESVAEMEEEPPDWEGN